MKCHCTITTWRQTQTSYHMLSGVIFTTTGLVASLSVAAALTFDTEKLNSSVLYWVNTRDTA